MRDFRELNQQINEIKRMLNSFIQKLTAQVELLYPPQCYAKTDLFAIFFVGTGKLAH